MILFSRSWKSQSLTGSSTQLFSKYSSPRLSCAVAKLTIPTLWFQLDLNCNLLFWNWPWKPRFLPPCVDPCQRSCTLPLPRWTLLTWTSNEDIPNQRKKLFFCFATRIIQVSPTYSQWKEFQKRKSWRENVRKEDYVWQVPMMREEATQLQEVQCDLLDWYIHLPSSARYHDCKFVQTPRQEPINLPKGRLWPTSQLWFVVTKFWAPADLICQNLLMFGRKVWH